MANPIVVLDTSHGVIHLELDSAKAPKTVENFLRYVDDGHYSGTIFHRVIDGFMVQGGGYDAAYNKKPTRDPVENEAFNGLLNERGTVAMARTSDPHSATAQFFINVSTNDFLNHKGKTPTGWGYTVFAKVVQGMDVADAIKGLPTGAAGPFAKDVPLEPVTIQSARRG
jgi:peptidyl-prolyl cis-trans isomerase B (cyclophilin B)